MSKLFTHVGLVTTKPNAASDPKVVRTFLRQTKKYWTDGTHRWPHGEGDVEVTTGTTWYRFTYVLHRGTIRELTPDEIRRQLSEELDFLVTQKQKARKVAKEANEQLDQVTNKLNLVRKKLARFDAKNPR